MQNRHLKAFILTASVLLAAFTWWQQQKKADLINELPDYPGKQLLVSRCTSCHDPAPILARQADRKEWKGIILWMQKMQGMPPLEEGEEEIILDYLEEFRHQTKEK